MSFPLYPTFREDEQMISTEPPSSSQLNIELCYQNQAGEVFMIKVALGTACVLLALVLAALIFVVICCKRRNRLHRHHYRQIYNPEQQPHEVFNENITTVFENTQFRHPIEAINKLCSLLFPLPMPCPKNITALRNIHKKQRENLKFYQSEQERIFE